MSSGSRHTVVQGESTESIAYAAGHIWETVWAAPENAELRKRRRSPHVLMPGDVVFVPPLRPRTESLATGHLHKLRRNGVPSKLILRFLADGEPRANEAYTFVCEGVEKTGTTDNDGRLKEWVQPLATYAEVRFMIDLVKYPGWQPESSDDAEVRDEGEDGNPPEQIFRFKLRHLDPSSTVSGAQARLHLLGYAVNGIDGVLDEPTHAALRAFQADHDMDVNGELDDATQTKLAEYTDG